MVQVDLALEVLALVGERETVELAVRSGARELEVTSYAEIVLARPEDDLAHPAFGKLFIETEYDQQSAGLLFSRRARASDEEPIWAFHVLGVERRLGGAVEWETDRARFLGRGRSAANPLALDASGLDPDVVKREKDVLADKYRQQGKPENVIEKIVESGLKTYYKEVCLLEQASIHAEHGGKSVAQALKEAEGKIGAPVKIAGFVRYALGEGIEKQESDFAAEVAAASGKK